MVCLYHNSKRSEADKKIWNNVIFIYKSKRLKGSFFIQTKKVYENEQDYNFAGEKGGEVNSDKWLSEREIYLSKYTNWFTCLVGALHHMMKKACLLHKPNPEKPLEYSSSFSSFLLQLESKMMMMMTTFIGKESLQEGLNRSGGIGRQNPLNNKAPANASPNMPTP